MASKVSPHASYAGTKANTPLVHTFFDKQTATWTYVVVDPATRSCYVIDPVLDYDSASGRVSFTTVEALKSFVEAEGLHVDRIIETHVHADHLTGAMALKRVGLRSGTSPTPRASHTDTLRSFRPTLPSMSARASTSPRLTSPRCTASRTQICRAHLMAT